MSTYFFVGQLLYPILTPYGYWLWAPKWMDSQTRKPNLDTVSTVLNTMLTFPGCSDGRSVGVVLQARVEQSGEKPFQMFPKRGNDTLESWEQVKDMLTTWQRQVR